MRVVKVLNNSLVLALDEQGREIILMGKGIGYHKASGYEFGPEEVEKVFVLRDRSITRSIIRLAAETDSVYFEIGKNVIDYAMDTYQMKLLDHIYLSLTDHLAFAVRRAKKEIIVPNFYTQDMQQFNPNEYRVGQYALQVIKEQTGVHLPEDEAGNIAFHFINAQEDHSYNEKNRKIKKLTEDVLDIVKYYYQLVYDEDSVAYSRYLTHIRLFAQRLVSGKQLPEDESKLLYDQIAQVCTSEFSCVKRVDRFVRERFGVAVTAQRSAIIPVDREARPLMDTIMWQDRRNAGICKELEQYNDLIFERSGAKINTVFSGSRMGWVLKNRPDVKEKLYKFVNIPEYVMHHMTGEYKTDVTYASRSHLMNLRTRKWDPEMLRLFGISEGQLCEILEPGSICGKVTAAFAAKTGLKEGTSVITSGGDQQCAAMGQGAYREGTLSLVAGTGGFLVTALDTVPEKPDPRLIFNCSSVAGRYMVEANVLTCCSAFDWFGKNFYPAKDGKIDYALIGEELEKLDGKVSSVVALPYFQGRSTPQWNPQAKAHFGEISLATGRGEMVKGLLEGIFLEIRNNILLFGEYAKIDRAYISGGLTNSEVINQI